MGRLSSPRLAVAQGIFQFHASEKERDTITVDCHIDIPWVMQKKGTFDLSRNNHGRISAVDFPRMQLGSLQVAIFALYLSDVFQDQVGDSASIEAIWNQIRWLRSQRECKLVQDADAVFSTIESTETPVFLGLEGGRLIQEDLDQLRIFRAAGIKYLTLTHNRNTSWADSATDASEHRGLTSFGKEVVKECNKLGVLIDVSHGSDATCEDAIHHSEAPVIASHSGCRALLDHPRNLPDRLIRRIAETGGVVHVPFARCFVGPTSAGIADHIDHIIQLVGASHVGIGSDLDGAVLASGAEDVSSWKHVVMDALASRGYSGDVIRNVAGMNTLRVLG